MRANRRHRGFTTIDTGAVSAALGSQVAAWLLVAPASFAQTHDPVPAFAEQTLP